MKQLINDHKGKGSAFLPSAQYLKAVIYTIRLPFGGW